MRRRIAELISISRRYGRAAIARTSDGSFQADLLFFPFYLIVKVQRSLRSVFIRHFRFLFRFHCFFRRRFDRGVESFTFVLCRLEEPMPKYHRK